MKRGIRQSKNLKRSPLSARVRLRIVTGPETKEESFQQPKLEKRHAGVRGRGIVLIGDPTIITEHLSFFGLDEPQEAIDGREP